MANGKQKNQNHQNGQRGGKGNGNSTYPGEIAKEMKKLTKFSALKTEELVKQGEEMGKMLARKEVGLTTSQIRKFLDAVNKIKSSGHQKKDFRSACLLLKPKLAYAAGRQKKAVGPLMTVLEPCIDKVCDEEDFTRFHRFVEAIVAYHRYYGGRDS